MEGQKSPLSVKEITGLLADEGMTKREFRNLKNRVRRSAELMVDHGIFLKEKQHTGHNIFCWKYSINTELNQSE